MGFSRQEYWTELPCPPPGDIPRLGIESVSPALAGGFFTTEPPEKPIWTIIFCHPVPSLMGFPGGSMVKNLPTNAGDAGDTSLIPESRRSPEEGNGKPLQYSCLGNPMDRGTWWSIVHKVAKELDTTEQLNLLIRCLALVSLCPLPALADRRE